MLKRSAQTQRLKVGGPLVGQALLWLTVLSGIAVLGWSGVSLARTADPPLACLILAASVVAELLKVRIFEVRRQSLTFSLSIVVIMAAVTIDPPLAPLAALLASAVHVVATHQRTPVKVAFNLFNLVVSAGCASWVYLFLRSAEAGLPNTLGALAAAACATLVYYVLNVGNISAMVALYAGRSFSSLLRESMWFAPTSILMGLTGAIVGTLQGSLGLVGTLTFMVPVLVMRFTLAFYAKRSAATIQHLDHIARHDALTGLPNRFELQEKLHELLSENGSVPVALLTMDLDRFREINDTFGHHLGDLLLQQIGPRLRAVLPETDLVVRLGGDEFAVLLAQSESNRASAVARDVLAALQSPFVVAGHRLDVGASIGVALAPDDGLDPATLLRCADVAMYVAKRDRSGFALHVPEQDQYSPDRLSLISELREAIECDELTLHFQPTVDTRTGRTRGAEALVRWRHPRLGLIPPDSFIPLAEHAGLIKPLTRWVLAAALRECRKWHAAGWDLSVAVNASVQDLRDSGFPEYVNQVLQSCGVAPSHLHIEITESAMMSDLERTRAVLDRVRALGVGISVDDFGTGYSSLSYLKRLPVNELKLDRSFVRDIAIDAEDLAIVRATTVLAHDLGLTVVAEGAEDDAALAHLRALQCDQVQGYVMSRPLPADQFAEWMTARLAAAAPLELAA